MFQGVNISLPKVLAELQTAIFVVTPETVLNKIWQTKAHKLQLISNFKFHQNALFFSLSMVLQVFFLVFQDKTMIYMVFT